MPYPARLPGLLGCLRLSMPSSPPPPPPTSQSALPMPGSFAERLPVAPQFLAALDDVAEDLNLPSYLVPIPHKSAAARTAAEPTNMRGIDSGNVFEPTGFIDTSESATAVFGDDIAEEATTAQPPQGDPYPEPQSAPHREPLSFETRYDGPEHAAPPVQDPPRGLDGNIPG